MTVTRQNVSFYIYVAFSGAHCASYLVDDGHSTYAHRAFVLLNALAATNFVGNS